MDASHIIKLAKEPNNANYMKTVTGTTVTSFTEQYEMFKSKVRIGLLGKTGQL